MTSSEDVLLHSNTDQFLGNIRIYVPAETKAAVALPSEVSHHYCQYAPSALVTKYYASRERMGPFRSLATYGERILLDRQHREKMIQKLKRLCKQQL